VEEAGYPVCQAAVRVEEEVLASLPWARMGRHWALRVEEEGLDEDLSCPD